MHGGVQITRDTSLPRSEVWLALKKSMQIASQMARCSESAGWFQKRCIRTLRHDSLRDELTCMPAFTSLRRRPRPACDCSDLGTHLAVQLHCWASWLIRRSYRFATAPDPWPPCPTELPHQPEWTLVWLRCSAGDACYCARPPVPTIILGLTSRHNTPASALAKGDRLATHQM